MASQPSPDPSTFFSMRIVSIDYYISPPVPDLDFSFSPFRGQKVDKVPVIRIYGSALSGQKTCMHLHRALPYLYVPCSDANPQSLDECRTYSRLICHSLENALKLRNSLESKKQHVHGFSLVRARSFYGYHRTDELFVKIYLYYPHEVSRAASLFLEGAVLNKAIQPYESHIPYLLQFLVDYNLYGMGLLHVSKLKFRLPILDHFASKESCNGKQSIPVMADSNVQLPQVCSVWDSSSIPSAWLWPSRGPTRQSTSALEGDAIVDDVLNQQFKMYTSLSQTKSEVKMVQSLVPIWEEEYLRTGNIEHVKSPDKGKPPPEYVLKEFCVGLKREKACLALYEEARRQQSFQGSPLAGVKEFVQSIKSMSEETSLFDKELGECNNSDGSFSAILHEESKEGMPSEQVQGGSKGDDQPCESLPKYSYTPLFQSSNFLEKKVADDDTLGLLRWLASSQAMDDLCTDDALVNEPILSPLLPKSMETVLEKAHLDYEIESQRECEDILDSVGTRHRDLDSSTSEQVIPQMDGSPDEQFLGHRMDELSKSQKKKVWGSLPLSNSKVMLNDFGCSNETKDISKCKYLDKIRDGVCEDLLNEENVSFASSLRELMRRKRVQQAGSSDDEIHGTKKLAFMKQKSHRAELGHHEIHDNKIYGKLPFFTHSGANDEESFTDCGNLEIPCEESIEKYRSSNPGRQAFASSFHEDPNECFSSRSKELAFRTVVGNVCNGDSNLPAVVSVKDYDEVDNHYINKAATSIFESGQNVDPGLRKSWTRGGCINDGKGKQNCLYKDGLQLDVYDVVDNVKSTELTLNIRPPPLDVGSRNIDHTNFFKMDNLNGSFFYERRPAENSPLFLDESGVEQKEYKYEGSEERGRVRNENLLGVPTHCLNDGSLLYLLTPASVPPSKTSVSHWLMQQKSHKLPSISSVMKEVRTIPLSPKYNKTEIEQPTSDDGMFSCSADCHLSWKLVSSKPVQTDGFDKIVASPSKNIIDEQDKDNKREFTANLLEMSQISGPESKSKITPVSQIGFRDPAAVGASQQLTMLSIEMVANSRGDLRPDPRHDAINIITLVIQEDSGHLLEVIVLTRDFGERNYDRLINGMSMCKVKSFSEEKCLIDEFMRIIHYFDPDILVGWEIQGGSLGFLAERAVLLGVRLLKTISRIPPAEANVSCSKSGKSEAIVGESSLDVTSRTDSVMLEDTIIEDEWGRTHASGLHVGGRIVLNLWRILSSEVKLNMYTLEAASEVVLRRKVPFIPSSTLMAWYSSGDAGAICNCIKYVVERAKLNFEIINHLDLIGRTAELARVYGIDFFSVLSRGSQYRVESMYLRLAHTQNYLSISPGNQQVASQPAMECLPLVMEPESGYYIDPVVVLDFQSLYPSMIIGYNLCYCTCLGKVMPSTINKLGVSSYSPDMQILADLKGEILLTPNGVMYVPQKIRKGVLPCMLEEILSTRVMVKQAMKNLPPSQQVLSRIFNARQLALKLIANVTYGYTAAGFSGRMPCAELADSIVQCGRKTLETAISFVNSHSTWNARVIYGDTDSMFVLLKGRTLREAFRIGQEIASEITAINPIPVTLKMEKVYYPCVLLTKKRYVGYSYEKSDQVEPIFDAKGIETVRRDSCSAVAKTLEQSLRILFESCNVSLVREYLERQWTRIFCGKITLQDFVFSKEVRLGTYRAHSLPPAALVATKAMKLDPRAEPRYAERIPYVVVHGEPGARLIDMVVDPLELVDINSPYRLNDIYYIRKQIIPALQRVFGLLGADLHKWFSKMHRPVKRAVAKRNFNVGDATFVQEFDDDKNLIARKPIGSRTRIDSYYLSQDCFLCGKLVQSSSYLCQSCSMNKPVLATALVSKTSKLERDMQHLAAICLHCGGGGGGGLSDSGIKCKSLACSIFYERSKVQKELQTVSTVATDVGLYPRCNVEWF